MRAVPRPAVALAFLLVAACSAPEMGPLMTPGQDCLGCHDGNIARRWSVAGTWKPGSRVTVTDSAGKTFTLHGNKVGNFYSAERLVFPISLDVDGKTMPALATYGGCNRCHAAGGAVGPPGPEMAPNQDCLACHDGAQARRWSAAGTWTRSGATVTLTDAGNRSVTVTTNRVGNFYTDVNLAFPLTASVDGARMPVLVTYGGCNRCHANGANGGGGGTNGPLMLPGQDCLACHDGAQALKWTVAGTWGGAGRTVTLVDSRGQTVTLTTNQVGNFYTSQALAFPLTARVGGQQMPDKVTYGGCNRCHGSGGGGVGD